MFRAPTIRRTPRADPRSSSLQSVPIPRSQCRILPYDVQIREKALTFRYVGVRGTPQAMTCAFAKGTPSLPNIPICRQTVSRENPFVFSIIANLRRYLGAKFENTRFAPKLPPPLVQRTFPPKPSRMLIFSVANKHPTPRNKTTTRASATRCRFCRVWAPWDLSTTTLRLPKPLCEAYLARANIPTPHFSFAVMSAYVRKQDIVAALAPTQGTCRLRKQTIHRKIQNDP